jgi:hypothetical protein
MRKWKLRSKQRRFRHFNGELWTPWGIYLPRGPGRCTGQTRKSGSRRDNRECH